MSIDAKHVIIGTAGHIDHGKTALVRALTGIDLDTLPDEKKRGITIELGFAFMDTPFPDSKIVFIDVPGHEKLVKTMVAGASSIDAALLVIAADDGISAQTIEHFDIIKLLGIRDGIIALTKSDLVDETHLAIVTEDVRRLVRGSFLEDCPIIPMSSITGAGVEDIRSALLDIAMKSHVRADSGFFRMPVDRVFTSQGFGTVVAGTVLSGEISVGDRIEILPDAITARVRGLQIHGENVQSSRIGKRTAINLHDIRKDQLRRGQCLCTPGSMAASSRMDARLHVQDNYAEELKNRTRVRLHIGTDEVIGRVVLLDNETMLPGQEGLVQFVLEEPTSAVRKDRFIIRTFSSQKTIGGGVILDACAVHHKRSDTSAIGALNSLDKGINDVVEQAFLNAKYQPQTPAEIAVVLGENIGIVAAAVDELLADGKLTDFRGCGIDEGSAASGKLMHADMYRELTDRLIGMIDEYYRSMPFHIYMPAANLKSKFLKLADKQVHEAIIADLCGKGTLKKRDIRIGIVGRQPVYRSSEKETAQQIEETYRAAGFTAPAVDEARAELRLPVKLFDDLADGLIDQGRIMRIDERILYHIESVLKARDALKAHFAGHPSVTAAEFRDMLGISRKYAIPLLEFFDKIAFTRREGDIRVLRQKI